MTNLTATAKAGPGFNDRVIAEFRANRGRVGAWGTHLVLIHHRGARTGVVRINPAMSLRDGDAWLVVGSAMGAPRDPVWARNLRANPDVEIEAATVAGIETVAVRATELTGREREAAFERFVRIAPAFETYQTKAGRLLPVVRLAPFPSAGARDGADRVVWPDVSSG